MWDEQQKCKQIRGQGRGTPAQGGNYVRADIHTEAHGGPNNGASEYSLKKGPTPEYAPDKNSADAVITAPIVAAFS